MGALDSANRTQADSKAAESDSAAAAVGECADPVGRAVGEWPEPAPRWGLTVSAILWLAWVAFLIWMMVLRIGQSGA